MCSSVCRATRPAAWTSYYLTVGSLNMADPRKDHPRFFCMDCDVDTYVNEQFYMLKDRLWRKINPSIDGMLRLPCAEKRLGRALTRRDFKKRSGEHRPSSALSGAGGTICSRPVGAEQADRDCARCVGQVGQTVTEYPPFVRWALLHVPLERILKPIHTSPCIAQPSMLYMTAPSRHPAQCLVRGAPVDRHGPKITREVKEPSSGGAAWTSRPLGQRNPSVMESRRSPPPSLPLYV